MQIKEILQNSKTIAIIGLSPKEHRDSYKVAKYLQKEGYKIIPIYPREEQILGQKVYRSILEVEEKIDIIDIFVNSSLVLEVVNQINKRNRDDEKIVWSQLGIFNDEAYTMLKNKILIVDKCIKIEHDRIFNQHITEPYNNSCVINFNKGK